METMRERGMTVLETCVLVAVVLGSGALVLPIVASEMSRGDRAEAQEQCRAIAVALELFVKDHGPPRDPVTGKPLHWMKGPGDLPTQLGFIDGGPTCLLAQVLVQRPAQAGKWSGPYLKGLGPDPWGRAFVVNAHGFHDRRERVWVLSAGPDGIVETPPESHETCADDIGHLLE